MNTRNAIKSPAADLLGESGRALLADGSAGALALDTGDEPGMVDDLDPRIDACEKELRTLGADHPSIPLLMTVPGVG